MFCVELDKYMECGETFCPYSLGAFCLKVLDIKNRLGILSREERLAFTKQCKINLTGGKDAALQRKV